MRRIVGLFLVCSTVVTLSGCMSNQKSEQQNEVLRIGIYEGNQDSEKYLRSLYTDLYELENKKVEFEFVQSDSIDPVDGLMSLMEGSDPPDIVLLNYAIIPSFINKNLLVDLVPYITKDNYVLKTKAANVIETLRTFGNGKLYALAPKFNSSALVYNKNLFEKANVPFPQDQITWDQTFEIAREIKLNLQDDEVYGFSFSWSWLEDLYGSVDYNFLSPLNISLFNNQLSEMKVNNESMLNIWSKVYDLYHEGIIPSKEDSNKIVSDKDNKFGENAFFSGKIAMFPINSRILYTMLKNLNVEGETLSFDWDITTLPIHPEIPNVGATIGMEPLFAINTKSMNPEAAWDFIKFINSEKWAGFYSNRSEDLLTEYKFNNTSLYSKGYNIEAFYKLTAPAINLEYAKKYLQYPNLRYIPEMGVFYFNKMLDGSLTPKNALMAWEKNGNDLLEEIKNNPAGAMEINFSDLVH